MKNDQSIFDEESDILYIKKDDSQIFQKDINNEMIKKEIKSELKLVENKKTKKSTIKIKKNLYSSYENILKNRLKH